MSLDTEFRKECTTKFGGSINKALALKLLENPVRN